MVNPTKEIAYGAAAGCLGKFIEFPFDTVKVRLQSAHGAHSTITVISHMLRQEGVLAFYKGIKAPLVGACLESGVLFSAYEYAQQFLRRLTSWLSLSMLSICTSGAASGFAASFVLTPVELVKCNLQVANLLDKTRHESYGLILSQIIKRHGLTGLWLGLSSTLMREMAGTAVWFAAYEKSSVFLNRMWPERTNLNALVSGATAGFLFNLSIFPVDTIKSNIQTAHISGRLAAESSFVRVFQTLVRRQNGVANLYNGLGITLVRSLPANAVIFYTYEYLKAHY